MPDTLLPAFQRSVLDEMKSRGLIPLSSGVTIPMPVAGDYGGLMTLLVGQADKTQSTYGPRTQDRYTSSVGSSYRDERFRMMSGFEGVKTRSYDDNGTPAIGLGFHFDRPNSRSLWDAAIGKSVSYDDAKAGKATITTAQAKMLFDHDVLYAEGVVNKAVGDRPLTQNQRLALVSVAYNAPSRVASWGKVLPTATDAQVMDLILHNSFNPGNPYADALKKRRYAEASMFGNPVESKVVMPAFRDYNAAVKVNPKTGDADLVNRLVGHGPESVMGLNSEFRGRLENMIQGAPDNIKSGLGIYSGYRSVEQQTQLFNDALKKYGSKAEARKWVAPPGNSEHNSGFAADLSYNGKSLSHAPKEVVDWVHTHAQDYGLKFPLANENWHVEPIETRQSGVPLAKTKLVNLSGLSPIPDSTTDAAAQSTTSKDAPQPMSRTGWLRTHMDDPFASTDDLPNEDLVKDLNDHFGTPPRLDGTVDYTTPPMAYDDRAEELRKRTADMDTEPPADERQPDVAQDDTRPSWVVARTTPGPASLTTGGSGVRGTAVPTSVSRPVSAPVIPATRTTYSSGGYLYQANGNGGYTNVGRATTTYNTAAQEAFDNPGSLPSMTQ